MLMLMFNVGNDRYACDCEHVLEVLPQVKLKPVPQALPFVAGLLNLGGTPIPVIDLCQLLENRKSEECMHSRIIMMRHITDDGDVQDLGMLAEKVTETRDLNPESFLDSGMKIEEINYIDGIMNDSQGMVRLLVVEKLFDTLNEIIFNDSNNLEG